MNLLKQAWTMSWIGDFVCNDKLVCGQWQSHRFFININFCLLHIVKFVEEEKENLAIQACRVR